MAWFPFLAGTAGGFLTKYSYMSPDSMIKTAGLLAIAASSIIIRTNTVVNGRCFVYYDADND